METSSLHVFRGLNCNKRKERTELHAQNQMGRMEAVSRLFHPLAETDRGLIQVSVELQYGQAA